MTPESPFTLLSSHTPNGWVAAGSPTGPLAASKTRADLLRDAAMVARSLPRLASDEQALLVFRQDRYAFAVALLAVWSRGYCACLPPNQRGATVSELLRPGNGGAKVGVLLHDTGAAGHISVPALLASRDDVTDCDSNSGDERPEPVLDGVTFPDGPVVRVMTSGSTGQSVPWDKTAAQLLSEVRVLADTFGPPQGAVYAVTVPPSHLYGLLFGVLLPLMAGGSFTRNTPLLPGEIAATLTASKASVLVSVPTHLRAARSVAQDCTRSLGLVFSSAGPLPEETARVFTARHGVPITEIFGSTETGGIAFRDRSRGSTWQALPQVTLQVSSAGLLVVTSPFTNSSGPRQGTFETSDRVNLLTDGRFEHLGRHDGVVKIGGQRISVPAMEDCLMQHPEVDDVAILSLPDDVRGHRLLAAISGAPDLEESCRELLLAQFEPSTLPRRFLFLDKLPREANGKLMRSRLLRLFGLNDEGVALSRALDFAVTTSDGEVRARVKVPADYIAYSGHFEQYAVMAGAVQLQHVVLPVLRSVKPETPQPTELRRIKFMGRIEPGDEIDVWLKLRDKECEFTLKKGDKICSAGALHFGAATTSPGSVQSEGFDHV